MGNAHAKPLIDQLFEQGVLACRHSPRIELTLPDHPACQACCQMQICEAHDPTNPDLVSIKTIVQNVLDPQTAIPSTSGQSNHNEEVENEDARDGSEAANENSDFDEPVADEDSIKTLQTEEVDADFSATRHGPDDHENLDLSDPTGDSVKTLHDLEAHMEEVEQQEEILRDAGGTALNALERPPLTLDLATDSDKSLPGCTLFLVTEPDGRQRLPSNSSRHELDKSYIEERRSFQEEIGSLDHSIGLQESGGEGLQELNEAADSDEVHQFQAPVLNDTDSEDGRLGPRHSTPRPTVMTGGCRQQLKRKTSRFDDEPLQSPSKKSKMAEPSPFRPDDNPQHLWESSMQNNEAVTLASRRVVKKLSSSVRACLREWENFEMPKNQQQQQQQQQQQDVSSTDSYSDNDVIIPEGLAHHDYSR